MEDRNYLKDQLITCLGNKRAMLPHIERTVKSAMAELGLEKAVCADLFSGSGCVSRLLKGYSSRLIANDLELYARIISECYLSDPGNFNEEEYEHYRQEVLRALEHPVTDGPVRTWYAPLDDEHIKPGERVFYTSKNAAAIDTIRAETEKMPEHMKKYFLGPLLWSASVHTNTGGVFKGFYKNSRTGIGQFGGNGKNALSRIKGYILPERPVLSPFTCPCDIYMEDAGGLAPKLGQVDIAYIDPPYNQHPYGSNYFMLNVIAENRVDGRGLSRVSGIPGGWNRSLYNYKKTAAGELEKLLRALDARVMIISYNSEGFISIEEMTELCRSLGKTDVSSVEYNVFKASRNLGLRSKYVSEYIFTVRKGI